MKFTEKPHQGVMIDWLCNGPRVNLWAGMGTGKTVCRLTSLLYLDQIQPTFPTLVVAPLRVANEVWPDEVKKWDHLHGMKVQPLTGTARQRIAACSQRAEVYTINYENLPWLADHFNGRWPFRTVIPDESTRLKNFRLRGQGGSRATALGTVAHKHVRQWSNLTGTPSPNGLLDLWGQAWFLDAGERLGRSFGAFRSRWFSAVKLPNFTKYVPHPFAEEQIKERLADITLAIDGKDWFDVAEPVVNRVRVHLPKAARRQYDSMEAELFSLVKSEWIEAPNAAVRVQKCLQMAAGAVYTGTGTEWVRMHDAKLDALASVIEEAAGAPILVAYQWKHDLARLKEAFPRGRSIDEAGVIQEWNAGKVPLLFAHPASAGHGLNLQDGGNTLVYFSFWWDAEQHAQILERIGPMRQLQSGYNRPVYVHYIIAQDTVDELVLARLQGKAALQDALTDYMNRSRIAA